MPVIFNKKAFIGTAGRLRLSKIVQGSTCRSMPQTDRLEQQPFLRNQTRVERTSGIPVPERANSRCRVAHRQMCFRPPAWGCANQTNTRLKA
eukprot:357822-Chlamydomonas_euryale.AAC.3